ncbi:hypothetical protein C7425_11282 [Pantoea ananatis]|uniref:hypothetical protein n=1 Tax=Pantoea ananas TaxID=553 RepID=UPI000D70934A|nr:hypothetical protein [Pantoea ananatis]PWV60419.1 hypothetical protein C7425_11282 [Pantoea ananatis]
MTTQKTVHIVKIKNIFSNYHIVEQEVSGVCLYECDTQEEAIEWAENKGYSYEIHRERNRKPGDKHGQFRKQ